ncbi:MAG: hypothetical protein ABL908_20060, partial [Hyphomicrobium sp.]
PIVVVATQPKTHGLGSEPVDLPARLVLSPAHFRGSFSRFGRAGRARFQIVLVSRAPLVELPIHTTRDKPKMKESPCASITIVMPI